MKTLTLKRSLVLASFLTMGAAAFVTSKPEADPNWGNNVVALASIDYLVSLLLIALDLVAARYLFHTAFPLTMTDCPRASYYAPTNAICLSSAI